MDDQIFWISDNIIVRLKRYFQCSDSTKNVRELRPGWREILYQELNSLLLSDTVKPWRRRQGFQLFLQSRSRASTNHNRTHQTSTRTTRARAASFQDKIFSSITGKRDRKIFIILIKCKIHQIIATPSMEDYSGNADTDQYQNCNLNTDLY